MEEKNLIELAQNGDKQAMDTLLNKNYSLVSDVINIKIRDNKNIKEELMGYGLFGLYKAIMNYNPNKSASFKTYAFECIKNEVIMHLRKISKYKKEISICTKVIGEKTLMSVIPDTYLVEDNILKKEEYAHVTEYLNELPTKHQKMLKLYYGFDGDCYTREELSQEFNCSKIVVGNYLTRGLSLLREKYSNELGYKITKMKRK